MAKRCRPAEGAANSTTRGIADAMAGIELCTLL